MERGLRSFWVLRYVLLFAFLVAAGWLLLFLSGLLPQAQVDKHLRESVELLAKEGNHPVILAQEESNRLDNFTDALILIHSSYLNTMTDPTATLANPGYFMPVEQTGNTSQAVDGDPVGSLAVVADENPESNFNYVRYWMGFRVYVRALLTVVNYGQIRRFIMWGFFLLSTTAALVLYQKTKRIAIPLVFTVSTLFLNPVIVASSLQFSICFFLAFIGMIWVCLSRNKIFTYPMIFVVLGAETQYFDFYTAPLLTCGLPAVAMLLVIQYSGRPYSTKQMWRLTAKCCAAWVSAYIMMWLAKLALTTAFTPINAFADGFASFGKRMGVIKVAELSSAYDPIAALLRCLKEVFNPYAICICAICLVVWGIQMARKKDRAARIRGALPYLAIAGLSIIWICVAAQPSYIHFWFQYRTLGLLLVGIGAFMVQSAIFEPAEGLKSTSGGAQ